MKFYFTRCRMSKLFNRTCLVLKSHTCGRVAAVPFSPCPSNSKMPRSCLCPYKLYDNCFSHLVLVTCCLTQNIWTATMSIFNLVTNIFFVLLRPLTLIIMRLIVTQLELLIKRMHTIRRAGSGVREGEITIPPSWL